MANGLERVRSGEVQNLSPNLEIDLILPKTGLAEVLFSGEDGYYRWKSFKDALTKIAKGVDGLPSGNQIRLITEINSSKPDLGVGEKGIVQIGSDWVEKGIVQIGSDWVETRSSGRMDYYYDQPYYEMLLKLIKENFLLPQPNRQLIILLATNFPKRDEINVRDLNGVIESIPKKFKPTIWVLPVVRSEGYLVDRGTGLGHADFWKKFPIGSNYGVIPLEIHRRG